MVPPGTKVIVHKKASNILSWGYHGIEGWYVGPTMDHYQCLRIYTPKTHSTIIADTVAFIPTNIPFPQSDHNTFLQQSVEDLLHLLKNNKKPKIPTIMYVDVIRNAILEIADILNRNKPHQIKLESKEPRVLTTKQKNNYEETRVKNEIKIPKLPSLQTFLKQYDNTTKNEKLNQIFDEDKKLSIDNLLQGPTKTIWQQGLDNKLGRLAN